MKIHADKIDREPLHGLRAAEVRRILAALPPEWVADVVEVRLSNALRRRDFAYFNRYDGTLTIYTRGRSPRKLIAPILRELAAHALGCPYRRGHCLADADLHRIRDAIQPLVDQLRPTFQPRLPRSLYHPSSTFRPVPLANGNA